MMRMESFCETYRKQQHHSIPFTYPPPSFFLIHSNNISANPTRSLLVPPNFILRQNLITPHARWGIMREWRTVAEIQQRNKCWSGWSFKNSVSPDRYVNLLTRKGVCIPMYVCMYVDYIYIYALLRHNNLPTSNLVLATYLLHLFRLAVKSEPKPHWGGG